MALQQGSEQHGNGGESVDAALGAFPMVVGADEMTESVERLHGLCPPVTSGANRHRPTRHYLTNAIVGQARTAQG